MAGFGRNDNYYLDVILLGGYILTMRAALESTEEYLDWFRAQEPPVQEAVRAYVKLLLEKGPSLARPYVDTLKGSRYSNLKELRVQAQGKKYRIVFIFTGERACLLLTADVKGGPADKRFYKKLIGKAEALYEEYMASR
jgi:hypothetical protein